MSKKSLKKNYVLSLAYEVLSLLVPLITTPYISRVLGAEKIGEFSYTYSIVACFAYFAALGTTVYARREVAYLQEKCDQRTLFFWEIIFLRLLLTTFFLLGYLGFLFCTNVTSVTITQSLYIVAVAFDVVWLFQGMENFTRVVVRNLIVKVLGIVLIFAFVKTKDDFLIYVLGNGLLPLLGSVIFWMDVKRYIGRIPPLVKMHPFRHVKNAFWLFIPTIASQVYLLLDKTMIGVFTDNNIENGFYEQSQKIVKICWTVITTFAVIMSPRIASIYAKKDFKNLRAYMIESFRFVWFLSIPIAFGLASITDNLIPWFFGNEFLPVKELLYIFSIIVVPVGIAAVTGSQYLVATQRQNFFTISIVCGALVNLLMNCFLIPRYFAKGAAVSSVCAEFVVAATQIAYIAIILKEFKLKDVFAGFFRYSIIGLCMFLLVYCVGFELESNFIHTLILIVVGVGFYTTILMLLKDPYMTMLKGKCLSLIQRFKR